MSEGLVELGVCLLVGAAGLAVVVWEVATGRVANLDGLTLSLVSLTLGGFFLFDVYWSYRSGELKELLKKKTEAGSSNTPQKGGEK